MRRIASIPASHPYVTGVLPGRLDVSYPHLFGPDVNSTDGEWGSAARLPDPVPIGGKRHSGVWWPHRMLDPQWWREHGEVADAVHLHFGFESRTPQQLQEWIAELRSMGLPLVFTVHDLANPHLADQTRHLAALNVLVTEADELVTLTDDAARRIEARWGRRAVVIPHPQIADDTAISASDAKRATLAGRPRVGMHLGAIRESVDPSPWLTRLCESVENQDAALEVVVNDEVLSTDGRSCRVLDDVARALEGYPSCELRLVRRFDDAQVNDWISSVDVLVLPYRHGTHSGWLELCWDLGASVLAPSVGSFADQHREEGFFASFDTDPTDALTHLLSARSSTTGTVPWGEAPARVIRRSRMRARIRTQHNAIYEALTRPAVSIDTQGRHV